MKKRWKESGESVWKMKSLLIETHRNENIYVKIRKNSEREPKNYLEIKILHFTSIILLCVVKIPQSLHLHATINSAIARQRYTWVVYIWKHWLEYSSPYTFHKSITACLRYDCQLLPLRKLQLNGVREKSCRSDRLRCNSVKRKVKKSIHSVRPSIFSSNDFFLSHLWRFNSKTNGFHCERERKIER